MRKAKFITIEGGDGSGKSTLLGRIEAHLTERGIKFIKTREPGGTRVAEEIRELLLRPRPAGETVSPLTELLLYEAARASHVEQVIRPALAIGTYVLCDRFTHSSLAYQGAGRGLGLDLVARLNDAATQGLNPDVVIWIKVPPAVARARVAGRAGGTKDRLESEQDSFHDVVFAAFNEISVREAQRFIVLDGLKSPDEVFAELVAHPHWKAALA